MLKDSRGITAFLDAMVFMGILVVALSMLSPGLSHADDGSPPPPRSWTPWPLRR